MTCTFGYVFLLSSAHKWRKFFLQTLVRLLQPEGLQQVVQTFIWRPSPCPETKRIIYSRLFKFHNVTIHCAWTVSVKLLIPDADSWSGAVALSLVAKYLNLFNAGGLAFTPACTDTKVDASDSDSHLHPPMMYLVAARSSPSISSTSSSFASVGSSKVALAGSGLNISHSGSGILFIGLFMSFCILLARSGGRKLVQVAVEVKKRWQNAGQRLHIRSLHVSQKSERFQKWCYFL